MNTPTATETGTAAALQLVQLAHDGGEQLFERLGPFELDRLDTDQLREAVLAAAWMAGRALAGYDDDTAERFRKLVSVYAARFNPRVEGPMDVLTPDGHERAWVTRPVDEAEHADDDDKGDDDD